MNLTRKILSSHLAVPSDMKPGSEIFIKVDHTLTHDINAVMTYLAFEAVGLPRTQVELSVSYLDHNLLYLDHKTPDDHIYLQSAAKKYGVYVSRPGNRICHAVHVARFGKPGKLSMGGDSHTPHGGAIGMLCIGVGGMDIATAMTGVPMRLKMPEVINVRLSGKLQPGCNAKDVILEMLQRVTNKGGLGKVYEYTGEGAESLEVPERARKWAQQLQFFPVMKTSTDSSKHRDVRMTIFPSRLMKEQNITQSTAGVYRELHECKLF